MLGGAERTGVSEVPHWLLAGGADGRILAEFALIASANDASGVPRYAPRSVCEPLARYLAGRGGGANPDTPLYELCHLLRAVDAAGRGRDRISLFFLGQERPSANSCRQTLQAALHNGGWSRPGFAATDAGIEIAYDDGSFSIRYGRMPFLVALYEFVLGLDDFAYAAEFSSIVEELVAAPAESASLRKASSALAARMRRYRRDHLSHVRHEATFDAILGFIRGDGQAAFDDETILAFWRAHNEGDFRLYATAFDAFVNFASAMAANGLASASERAQSLSGAGEDADLDLLNSAPDAFDSDDWQSPLPLLDQEPACRIRVLIQSSERRPLEPLMQFGPHALRLPLAFLRREVFGAVQSAITTDLQVRRESGRLPERLDCRDAEAYDDRRQRLAELTEKLHRLQLACLHAMLSGSDDVPGEPLSDLAAEQRVELLADCARAFRMMTRKGFEEDALADEAHRDGFRIAGDVLRRTGQQVAA